MSRTTRGSKGAGYEYWSRRPHSKSGVVGKYAKRYTIKAERMIERRIILNELEKTE